MGDEACSVTVVGSRRRVDLALPGELPVAELLWELVDLLEEPEGGRGTGRWGLVRMGGRELDGELGLGAQGVVDGALLFLRDLSRPAAPPVVDDYAEAVALAVDVRGGRWSPAAREDVLLAAALAWLAFGAAAALR